MTDITRELLENNIDYEVTYDGQGTRVSLMLMDTDEVFAVIKRNSLEECFAGLFGLMAKTTLLSKVKTFNDMIC